MDCSQMRAQYDSGHPVTFHGKGATIDQVVDALRAGVGDWGGRVLIQLDGVMHIVTGAHLEYPKMVLHIEEAKKQPKLDPNPWVYALMGPATESFTPAREATQVTGGFVFDPRPQYSQFRGDYPE